MIVSMVNPEDPGELLNEEENGLKGTHGTTIPRIKGAYRFVDTNNYASTFGMQWKRFERTQIDRFQDHLTQSKERFFAVTGWDVPDLTNQNILEVGSGAGRFTQVVLDHTAANLYSVDYSDAVEVNYRNNGSDPRLKLFQASIYQLPFESGVFDKVFCFGVLQHTPDFRHSLECLADMVKPGGELVVDFYPRKGWFTKLHAKYLLRPITKRIKPGHLLSMIENNIELLIYLYQFFDRIGLGKIINRFVPICDIKNTLPPDLPCNKLKEWAILDTFDMFSPQYDNPQSIKTVKKWLEATGLKKVWGGNVSYGSGHQVAVVKAYK